MHNEPSDVMPLVICPETRGEILLRCHYSVKPHTAGQISLTRRILLEKSQLGAIPDRTQTWPVEAGSTSEAQSPTLTL